MHLTNYSLNKHNKKFIKNEGEDKDDVGHKRSLTFVLKVFFSPCIIFNIFEYLKYRGLNEKKI